MEHRCNSCRYQEILKGKEKCSCPLPCNDYSAWSPVEPNTINHPSHYTQGTLEVIDAIEGLNLGYLEGNILKYISRYKYKNGIEDLEKAAWYIKRLIDTEEKL